MSDLLKQADSEARWMMDQSWAAVEELRYDDHDIEKIMNAVEMAEFHAQELLVILAKLKAGVTA